MTRSTCSYTIAPYTDSEEQFCGKEAVCKVTFKETRQSGKKTEMSYCFQHWQSVRDIVIIQQSEQEHF